jgi:uncharacterized protein (TIGR02001 family)
VLASPAILRLARFAAPFLFSAAACGQVGGSIVAESDYRYRGVSLNGQDSSLRVSVAYDHPGGWYAGASLARVEFEPGLKRAAPTVYAGYVHRNETGWAWETGVTLSHFCGDASHDYGEAFGGLIGEGWSARLYFAPHYFGGGVHTMYAELNVGWPLSSSWRAFAHLGALARLTSDAPVGSDRLSYDGRAGLGLRMTDWEVQLAWVASNQRELYPVAYGQRRSTVVLSAGYDF